MKRIKFDEGHYIEAKTKDGIVERARRLRNSVWTHTSNGRNRKTSGFYSEHYDVFVVYNIHKKNRKMSPDKKTLVTESYWYGYVYVIPAGVLRAASYAKLEQKTRNFVLELTI